MSDYDDLIRAIAARRTYVPKGHEQPHGRIQWKGTDVCVDIYCVCGYHGHVDAEFAYYVRCGKCGAVYECNPHIELVPLQPGELVKLIAAGVSDGCIVDTDKPGED